MERLRVNKQSDPMQLKEERIERKKLESKGGIREWKIDEEINECYSVEKSDLTVF